MSERTPNPSNFSRRTYLKLTTVTTAAAVGTATFGTPTTSTARSPTKEPIRPGFHGAIYWPTHAFNHYQTWYQYDSTEVNRDFTYAKSLNLHALRVIVGWEFWRDYPQEFQHRFDNFLRLADKHNLQILPVFFEAIGDTPTERNFLDKNPLTSFAVKSPSTAIIKNKSRWEQPQQFVDWFTRRYSNHSALIALEIMNEPGAWTQRVRFCQSMLRTAHNANPDVDLTMGCKDFRFNQLYDDPGLDIHQFHLNIPPTNAHMEQKLEQAIQYREETGTPIWLTEWQRARTPEPPHRMRPNYSSIASTVYNSDIDGDFFWQLMLKPAYMKTPRKSGRLNGLFHQEGSVYSQSDATAIAYETNDWEEQQAWPFWATQVRQRWDPISSKPLNHAG